LPYHHPTLTTCGQAGKSKLVTKADIKASHDTAKVARKASNALRGAAGHAQIAAKHLGAADVEAAKPVKGEKTADKEALKRLKAKDPIAEVKEETKRDDKKEFHALKHHPKDHGLKPLKEKKVPVVRAMAKKISRHHKTLKKIRTAIDSSGSEEQKISKVKDALEDNKAAKVSSDDDMAPTHVKSGAASGVTKKMLVDMEKRNKRWEKRSTTLSPAPFLLPLVPML
jgi:hypothetical protein